MLLFESAEETFMQGKQSTLWSSVLRKSNTINATKAVTCRRKSRRTASAANIENTRTAGIGMNVPTANANTSDRLASVIDGPTSTKALLMRPSKGNSSDCLLTACTNMHMLSTPTAKTRKGMTSIMIRVDFTPTELKNPTDPSTESMTKMTPESPSSTFEEMKKEENRSVSPRVSDI
uniref:Uncharacterized protein n=1 Tax=Opuntia streptacantha TaxID=393608 RepID=A0A7C8ZWA3_OPUST